MVYEKQASVNIIRKFKFTFFQKKNEKIQKKNVNNGVKKRTELEVLGVI